MGLRDPLQEELTYHWKYTVRKKMLSCKHADGWYSKAPLGMALRTDCETGNAPREKGPGDM